MECTGKLQNVSSDWKTNKTLLTFEINEKLNPAALEEVAGCEKLNIKFAKYRKKRSLDANAYLWKLCDEIAQKIHSTKEAVYQDAIRAVGVFSDVLVDADASEKLIFGWLKNGTGWVAEVVDGVAEMLTVRLYYGSSTYDSKQMARLIGEVIESCKLVGVEYLPPHEIERMVESWGKA